MTYARDPYDTDQPPCFCDQEAGPTLTTQEFCPAHGDPAKTMADSMIEALGRQRHTVHFHWPTQCGFASVPEGDTWSGNLGDVTCGGCREESPSADTLVEVHDLEWARRTGPVAVYLDEVRLRSRTVGANGGPGPGGANRRHRANEQSARDVPRLIAAVDVVLRLASELDAEDVFNPDWPVSRGDRIRAAIATALLETRMIV